MRVRAPELGATSKIHRTRPLLITHLTATAHDAARCRLQCFWADCDSNAPTHLHYAASAAPCPEARPVHNTTGALSHTQAFDTHGLSVVTPLPHHSCNSSDARPPYTVTASAEDPGTLATAGESPCPPPLYFPPEHDNEDPHKDRDADENDSPPAFTPAPPFSFTASSSSATASAETKAALPRDTKDGSSSKDIDDGEPPPPYSEGYSPLESFTYVMASAGGPASIITQVSQQSAGPPINTLGGSDENITLELR